MPVSILKHCESYMNIFGEYYNFTSIHSYLRLYEAQFQTNKLLMPTGETPHLQLLVS